MFSQAFQLLQNEGELMKGCFKSSFTTFRVGEDADRGHLYSASFQYAIGLERLLKIILAMDQWHRKRTFPTTKELQDYGHNILKLFKTTQMLFPKYKVGQPTKYDLDPINQELLNFFSDFANGRRYFNLDTLSAPAKTADPIEELETLLGWICDQDAPDSVGDLEPGTDPEEADDAVDAILQQVTRAAALPHLSWRLIFLLIPLRDLLVAVREQIHSDDSIKDGIDADPSVPYMEEFLDFVCEDKNVIVNSKDWP